jgi:hypothetical protein
MKALPNHECPLCGEPNQCAPAKTGDLSSECWCTAVVIGREALHRVPEELRGKACLCPRCASAAFCDPPST